MALKSLSCGQYDIYVAQRGGTPLICRLGNTTDITYGRKLNDFSEATVTATVDATCRECMSYVNPWEHEILIFRDTELVWTGPIVTLTYRPSESQVEIYARDLFAWTDKRVIEIKDEDYEVEEVDIKEVFEWVLSHGYDKDPWGMVWDLQDTGVPISQFYPAYLDDERWGGTYRYVGAELRRLSQSGIDFTIVNRVMYAGDLEVSPPVEGTLKIMEQNWAQLPEITINGTVMSTRTIVAGGAGGFYGYYDDQIWIEESVHPWGLLESFHERVDLGDEDTTVLPNAITQEAYARHQLLSTPLAYITGGQLAADAPFDFNTLVPGLRIEVGFLNSIRDVEIDYRVYSISVSVNAEAESISIELSSTGVLDVRTGEEQ